MEVADVQLDASPEQVQALRDAFAHFCEQTAHLQAAYDDLKRKAERVSVKLEAANREMERKVRELDEANNFMGGILASIPTAVVVTDLTGGIRALNTAAEVMWGASAREASGRHFLEVMGSGGEPLAAALAGRPGPETVRRSLEDGAETVISTNACLVRDSSGRPIGAVQVDRDITRLCALEARVRHQEKLADLGKMAAALAHEIRKPLNGIKGFASILGRRIESDEAQTRCVTNISAAADRLNAMLGRLLDFARPDAPRLTACDLRAEAGQVADFVRAEDPDRPADVAVEVPDEARIVRADRDRIKQVLLNLVKNGVEALDGPGRVTVRAHAAADGRVRVAVEDTGRGIAPEKLSRIFEPFYTDKAGGTGLGLAIVSRILELHGTQLDVDSRPGQGTRMSFTLEAAEDGDAT
jgi:PAS domain S-box-containing protein